MLLAEGFSVWDPLSWKIVSTISVGPLNISPHGIGIAAGYLAGAILMVRRARRKQALADENQLADGAPDENDIWNCLFYALIGAIVGARVGYVLGHFSEVTAGGDDLLGVFKVWEGGISLIGGITGAVLAALPYMFRHKMGFWRTMDLAAPGLALGIVIGRIGDLIIGDHLGKPTEFPLGWRCLGDVTGGIPPRPASDYLFDLERGEPPSLGCFDLTLHQTALYDFFSTLALLGVLLVLGRSLLRKPGFMIIVFTIWYATMRVITDFLRVDQRYFGLTGSQLMSLGAGLICLFLLARYGGAPPRWARSGGGNDPPPDAESEQAPVLSPSGAPSSHAE